MTKYRTEQGVSENIEDATLSLCSYDVVKCCGCMTKSILSEDGTHFTCGKCGATK